MDITLTINGQSQAVADETTVETLLAELGKNPKLCAVEVNRELVPRSRHSGTILAAGDVVEIVTLVGGG